MLCTLHHKPLVPSHLQRIQQILNTHYSLVIVKFAFIQAEIKGLWDAQV